MTKEINRSACGRTLGSVPMAALSLSLLAVTPVAGIAQDDVSLGCVVRSIDLEPGAGETLLNIRTDGEPASLGARLEAGGGVALDLAGCAPAPELSGRSFADGLVSALELAYDSDAPGLDTAVVVRTRSPFEYSVSSNPGGVSVVLRAKAAGMPAAQLVRVLEPLPPPSAPAMSRPSPEPAPPAAETVEATPPASSAPRPEVITPSLRPAPAPDTVAIGAAVDNWARAWSEQRVDDYLAAYADGFQPPQGMSRADWEAQRRERLAAPRFIEIAIDGLKIRAVAADRAIANFVQSYLSDSFNDQVYKSLTMTFEDGRWRILAEQAGEAQPE